MFFYMTFLNVITCTLELEQTVFFLLFVQTLPSQLIHVSVCELS